ncbi:hypothetical protein NKW57_15610, partial [Acetobacter cerevisiae]|nr:hypothetical protein [Acetobacter cerevisiae]
YSRSGSCGMTEFYKMTRNCLKCEKSASKVPVMDGANHPNDTGKPAQLAGTLHFESTSKR